jgi:hypothetical protein
MEYHHELDGDEEYNNDTVFSEEQLLELDPDIISRWMKKKAYGTDAPGQLIPYLFFQNKRKKRVCIISPLGS